MGRKHLTEQEIKELLVVTNRFRDHLMLRMLYETGMRVSELVALNISHVNTYAGIIQILTAKRHPEGREISIWNDVTVRMLEHHILGKGLRDPLFRSNKGGRISKRQVQRIYTATAERAGIPPELWHIHALRHTFTMLSVKYGNNLLLINKMLGHTTISGTEYYINREYTDNPDLGEEYKKMNSLG